MKFDEINLDDDKIAPKLDLDFDLDHTVTGGNNKSSTFSFGGGWGGGWGSGPASWGFGSSTDAAAPKPKDDLGWSFSSTATSKKDKDKDKDKDKKKNPTGFDFGFDNPAGAEDGGFDIGTATTKNDSKAEDPWSNLWSSTTTSKKDKKKKKEIDLEPDPAFEPPPPPPPAIVEEDDAWNSFATKKDKKKKKGAAVVELIAEPEPEPEPIVETKEEPPGDDMWSSWGLTSKAKTKNKKAGKIEEKMVEEPVKAPEPEVPVVEPAADDFDGWGLSTSKNSKKTKKKSTFDWASLDEAAPEVPPPPPPAATEPEKDDFFGAAWADTGTKKKEKKSKKNAILEEPPPPPIVPEPITEEKDWGDEWGTAKDKKKKKKDLGSASQPVETFDDAFLMPEAVVEPNAEGEENWFGEWNTGTKKKGSKKDKSKGITELDDSVPDLPATQPESVQEKPVEDLWTTGKKEKKKKKGSLLDPTPPPAPTPPDQGLDDIPATSTDLLGGDGFDDPWSFTTSTKKKGSKVERKPVQAIEPAKPEGTKLTKTKSKDEPKASPELLDIFDDDDEPPKDPEPPKDDKKATKATSGWGVSSLWGGSKAKTTKEKEKEAKDKAEKEKKEKAEQEAAEEAQRQADEAAFAAALDEDSDDILDMIEEIPPPKKSAKDKGKDTKDKSIKDKDIVGKDVKDKPVKDKDVKDTKKKGDDKLSKVDSKTGKKLESKKEEPIDMFDDPILDFAEEPPQDEGKSDGWGFWGSSLKSTKKATTVAETKNKIAPDPWANQSASAKDKAKMPESIWDEEGSKPATSPPKSTAATSSKTKAGGKSSTVADRIKALQEQAEAPAKPSAADKKSKSASKPPPPKQEPEPEIDSDPESDLEPVPPPPPPADKKAKKSTVTAKSSTKKDTKNSSSPVDLVPPKPALSPVPGGFPLDDFFSPDDEIMSPPPAKSSKDKKSSSKATPKKEVVKEATKEVTKDVPSKDKTPAANRKSSKAGNSGIDDLVDMMDDEPAKLPTPPPDDFKDKSKSNKKERPKVVRDQGSSSWGFWGATPPPKSSNKKDSTSKDGDVSPIKERPAELTRSKSARKASEKDPVEKASKSSGSDKDGKKDSKQRTKPSRGMSFSMFGMGGTPSRSKSTRQPSSASKPTSRRQSTAVDDLGLVSPPPDDAVERNVSSKAQKVMGVERSKSTREKPTRKVPDPYSLDSDDLLMIDRPEDSAKDVPVASKEKKKKSTKTKRQSTYDAGNARDLEDEVMGDAPGNSEEAKAVQDPDDPLFVDRPSPMRRTTSSAKKPGLMGGIFGFGSKPTPERRQSKTYESEEGVGRRKRSTGYDDEYSKRLRREDRKVNRTRKVSEGDILEDAAPTPDADDPEARRRERRERREREGGVEVETREAKEARREARRNKAREEEDRLARADEEREERRKEDRRARREARRVEEERIAKEEEERETQRREEKRAARRADRERIVREEDDGAARPKTDRRRSSYMSPPPEDDDAARRVRREERRVRRSVDPAEEKERIRTSRRRSDYPAPVDGYFDKRYGEQKTPRKDGAIPAPLAHAIKAGGDKTASWVASINHDPPPPPPLAHSIVDAPVHFTEDTAPDTLDDNEKTAREFRQRRRRERDGGYVYDDEDVLGGTTRRGRGEGGGVRSSDGDGSAYDRRKSYAGPGNSLGYNDMGRPAMPNGRRNSWFKKLTGF